MILPQERKWIAILVLLGGFFLSTALVSFYIGDAKAEGDEQLALLNAENPAEPSFLYGIQIDSFKVIEDKIKPNQFLGEILLKQHIPYPIIDQLVKEAKAVFNVRDIAAGKHYYLLCSNDEEEKARYFIYENSATQAIIFDIDSVVRVYPYNLPITTQRKVVHGVVESSLYESLKKAGAPTVLALKLADIYAWSIDFYRVQKGDEFRVIYNEQWVEDKIIGVSEIEASSFTHRGEDLYAFLYEDEFGNDYYDEQGRSLRKAFLQAPLKFGRLTSAYTLKRFHPVQKRWKAHLGTDYAAPTGTPILAVGDGTVLEATFSKYNGNYVKIKHNGTYTTQYLHMSKFASGIKAGARVKQGQTIGYVGSTGLATGPHVCFRFWKNGKQVDHRSEKMPASKPISSDRIEAYKAHIEQLMLELKQGQKQDVLAQNQ